MAAAVGSIIGGVLQGTGGAGSEFSPVVQKGIDKAMISQKPETPKINNAEVKPVGDAKTNWQALADQANVLGQKKEEDPYGRS